MKNSHPLDIIVVTYNNPDYLYPCIQSMLSHCITPDLFRIIIVNNGHKDSVNDFRDDDRITVIDSGKNLGWEGGLALGLRSSTSEIVCFANDDIFIPVSSMDWANRLLSHFQDQRVAAVGPSSNVVMGGQNIFSGGPAVAFVKFLIGFCLMVRREDLNRAGGVDITCPGGDDLDLSIRLRGLDKYLMSDRRCFVWHHGFKTGERVEGTPDKGGWNSIQKIERTNNWLINKHGLLKFHDLWTPMEKFNPDWGIRNAEKEIVKKYVVGEKVLDLGCGPEKTVENCIGIDSVKKGDRIPGLANEVSAADICADVTKELPVTKDQDTVIVRHILEHCVDPVSVLKHWRNLLKPGGRLILALPDEALNSTIPLNYQHVHAYTKQSLGELMSTLGWRQVAMEDCNNMLSFVGVFEKNGHH